MRDFFFFWAAMLLWVSVLSCGSDSKPPIEFSKMKSILYDVYVAEVRAGMTDSAKGLIRDKDSLRLNEGYTAVLQHHQVDLVTFEKALIWYTEHPLLLDSMYKNLIAQNDSLQRVYEEFRDVQPTMPQDPEERAAMETAELQPISN